MPIAPLDGWPAKRQGHVSMRFSSIFGIWVFLLLSAAAQQPTTLPTSEIVAQSQQALSHGNHKQALRLVMQGLVSYPDNDELELQLARIFVYEKHDAQAMAKINTILHRDPSNREAKLALAQVYGYREDYTKSDPIYRELLRQDPGDEAAALGLIHNLVLEGKRQESRLQLDAALKQNPDSLLLQEYNDFLTASAAPVQETRTSHYGRIQSGESFFSDSSGNRSLYSAQALGYQITRNLSSRTSVDETALWKTAVPYRTVLSGWEDLRWRFNRYVAARASGGAVRFADSASDALYAGDLEIYPFKGASISGGYSRFPILPTFDAAGFDLLAAGWHEGVEYNTRNFSLNANGYLTHYSDGNRSERESGEAMRWFPVGKVSIGAGYAFRHIHFEQELDHGYFSPSQYWSHLGAGGVRFNIGKFYRGEYLGYLGGEKINAGGFTNAGEMLLRNQFFYRRWNFEANYSHYQLVQSTAAFRSDVVSGAVGYRF
jgi:tetratricopeptide (TPR) repeat protein